MMDQIILYYPEGHESHVEIGHPERPERVESIRSALLKQGYWDDKLLVPSILPPDEVLTKVHTKSYLEYLERTCREGLPLDADTFTTPASWNIAINTAGGAIAVVEKIWQGIAQRGFALTRPPGHHATSNQGMGFCLLNNIAIATEYLIMKNDAKRLAIVDLDLHHGNGTQEIFWARGDVFYISTHQYPYYPGTGDLSEIGVGDGTGKTANFPLPPGSGNLAFTTIMQEIILPLINRFQPEMILVSCGFDSHWKDPLGHLLLSAEVYGKLIKSLVDWADDHCAGKIALFLEGGYDLEASALCSESIMAALLDRTFVDRLGDSPKPEGKSWKSVFENAKQIWSL